MWKYIGKYLPFAILAAGFMLGEVWMDLLQPGLMSRIVDEGILRAGGSDLQIIKKLGLQMISLAFMGIFCGSMNNIFVHLSCQNIGNGIRKDCFCHKVLVGQSRNPNRYFQRRDGTGDERDRQYWFCVDCSFRRLLCGERTDFCGGDLCLYCVC